MSETALKIILSIVLIIGLLIVWKALNNWFERCSARIRNINRKFSIISEDLVRIEQAIVELDKSKKSKTRVQVIFNDGEQEYDYNFESKDMDNVSLEVMKFFAALEKLK